MKKIIPLLLLTLCLTACTPSTAQVEPSASVPATEDTKTPTMSPPPTEKLPVDLTENPAGHETKPPIDSEFRYNEAYAAYDNPIAAGSLGIILNEPFENEPKATVTWGEDDYERAYIIPKYVGSYVNLFGVIWDENDSYTLTDKAVHSAYVENGTVIYGALSRPEGQPKYYLSITAPDGTEFGMLLSYNGRIGTPPEEYLCPMVEEETADALLQKMLGSDYSWGIEEEMTLAGGIPCINYRVTRIVIDDGGSHQSYVCNALVAPDGVTVYSAEFNPESGAWQVNGMLADALDE